MIKVVGYEKKKGLFTNQQTGEVIDYDNIILYCINDNVENVQGCYVSEIKVKRCDFLKICGHNHDDVIDHEIKPYYAPYGSHVKLSSIEVLNDWEAL